MPVCFLFSNKIEAWYGAGRIFNIRPPFFQLYFERLIELPFLSSGSLIVASLLRSDESIIVRLYLECALRLLGPQGPTLPDQQR